MLHNLVSVRLNKQGINIRIFVNLTENKVKLISRITIVFVNNTSLLCSYIMCFLPVLFILVPSGIH